MSAIKNNVTVFGPLWWCFFICHFGERADLVVQHCIHQFYRRRFYPEGAARRLYLLVFNLKVMSAHKRDMQNTVNFLAGALYHQQETRNLIEEYRNSNAIHVLQPYGFLDTMTKRINQDPSKGKHFFQILFLLPAIVIPAVPYIAMVYMLIYVRMELYDDIIGVLGFWVTIAIFMFLLFYLTKEFLTERQRARDNHALAREMEKEEG